MIVVRDIFRLKFGQAKEPIGLWKQAVSMMNQAGFAQAGPIRLLTDLVGGQYYTVILESTFASVSDWEKAHESPAMQGEWKELYAKIISHTESGRREILKVVG